VGGPGRNTQHTRRQWRQGPETTIGAASPIGSSDQGPTELPETYKRKLVEEMQAMVRSLATRRSSRAVQFAQTPSNTPEAASARRRWNTGWLISSPRTGDDLLRQVDGFEVEMNGRHGQAADGRGHAQPESRPAPPNGCLTSSPTHISFLLLAVGVQALLIELSNPGMWVPGFGRVVCLALFIYSIGVIPVNLLGLVFIATAFVLFILDVKAPTHGAMTAAGIGVVHRRRADHVQRPIAAGQIRFQPISIPLVVGVGLAQRRVLCLYRRQSHSSSTLAGGDGINTLIGQNRRSPHRL